MIRGFAPFLFLKHTSIFSSLLQKPYKAITLNPSMGKTTTLDQLKKFAVIATIGILFAVLAFSISDLILDAPAYDDYCDGYGPTIPRPREGVECEDVVEAPSEFQEECRRDGGRVSYEVDEDGCAIDYECDTCSRDYSQARESHQMLSFIIVSLIGLAGIFSGIYVKVKDEIAGWLLSGFIIGGLISIFVATISFFSAMDPVIRPIVIIAEIALVSWLTMRIRR